MNSDNVDMSEGKSPPHKEAAILPGELEELLGKEAEYFWLMFFGPRASITQAHVLETVRRVKKIKTKKEQAIIHLVLNSRGGDIYAAYKILNIIRNYCGKLVVTIPFYAKSAATLIALGGDRIIMGPQSELGPLDIQIEHPLTEGLRMSGLDGVRPLDLLSSFVAAFADTLLFERGALGPRIRQRVGISRKDAVELALRFASDYVAPVTSKLEPAVINLCYRQLDIAARYGKELLAKYMFKDQANAESKAEDIADRLVWDYPAHDFAICFDEVKKLGLTVSEFKDYPYSEQLWQIYEALGKVFEEDMSRVVLRVLTKDEFERLLSEGESNLSQVIDEQEKEAGSNEGK